jgi:hypothetical protein
MQADDHGTHFRLLPALPAFKASSFLRQLTPLGNGPYVLSLHRPRRRRQDFPFAAIPLLLAAPSIAITATVR